jgi:alkanesulfonate monooxygenase SsuD/methylene tetrahydromethanopterin reductase-like flavin-dependent oxidoreductase (luciferase family)
VQVSPALAQGQASPEVWLLGSSLWGAAAAAHWGLPYAFAHFFSPVATRAALESYRNAFMPRHLNLSGAPQLAAPKAVAAVGVIVADSDEEARFLHSSVRLLQRRIRMGDRRPVASPEDATRILRDEFGEQDKSSPRSSAGSSAAASQNGRLDVVMNNEEGEFPRYIVGSPSTVRHELGTMSASLGLSEILVNTIVHDHASRLRSYSLLAAEFASDAQVQADRAEPLSQRAAS